LNTKYKTIKEIIEDLGKYPEESTIEVYLAEDEGLIVYDKNHNEIGFIQNYLNLEGE
jgi:hypothetical protein